jgi:16S rRNA (uracil1498-N3)-methyltransferase
LSASRFFVSGAYEPGDLIALDGADAHKIANVLRLGNGDSIEVIDSCGILFDAAVLIGEKTVRARLLSVVELGYATAALRVAVAQAIPKGSKMDFVVEKLTELGVTAIQPFESERSVVTGSSAAKLERWRRLAKAAAQQCGRRDVPFVHETVSFANLVTQFAGYDRVLFLWELAERVPLRESLPAALAGASTVLAVIGPEGGFSHAEAQLAASSGAHSISLGSRILRTETAGLALVSIVEYLSG